jgi:signal transduction histidine kinase
MSLRGRLLAAFAYTLLIVLVALEVPLGQNLSDRVNSEVEVDATSQAEVVAAEALTGSLRDLRRLRRLVRAEADQVGGRVLIVDRDGAILADSSGVPPGTGYATPQRPELTEALAGSVAQGRRHSDTLDEDLLVTAVPVLRGGRPVGAVRVSQSVEDVNAAVRDDVLALIAVGALALLLGLGVAWILAGSIAGPIRALAAAARRMASGDLRTRAKPTGSREQVELANAFNEMAERLEAVLDSQRAFVADASHQLRTPLTGLRLRLEAAAASAGEGEVAEELAAAERETERLGRLVDDLLTLASSEQRPAAEPTSLPQTLGDLAVVLDNLIENAIRYSDSGSLVELGWSASDGQATVAVSNLGPELAPEEHERAFERFYRGPSRGRGGTGLGLAIVQALIQRSGGSVRLRSADGRVVAEVKLPLAQDFANP